MEDNSFVTGSSRSHNIKATLELDVYSEMMKAGFLRKGAFSMPPFVENVSFVIFEDIMENLDRQKGQDA